MRPARKLGLAIGTLGLAGVAGLALFFTRGKAPSPDPADLATGSQLAAQQTSAERPATTQGPSVLAAVPAAPSSSIPSAPASATALATPAQPTAQATIRAGARPAPTAKPSAAPAVTSQTDPTWGVPVSKPKP